MTRNEGERPEIIPEEDRAEGPIHEPFIEEDEDAGIGESLDYDEKRIIGFHSLWEAIRNARSLAEMTNQLTKIPAAPPGPNIRQFTKALNKIDQLNSDAMGEILEALSKILGITTSVETRVTVHAHHMGEQSKINQDLIAQSILSQRAVLEVHMPAAMRAADLDSLNRCTIIEDGPLVRIVAPIDRNVRKRLPNATVSGWFWSGDSFVDSEIRPFLLLSAQKLRPIAKRILISGQ